LRALLFLVVACPRCVNPGDSANPDTKNFSSLLQVAKINARGAAGDA
jgi:hypothetical protein